MARTNLEMIGIVATRLGPLIDRVVFLGGAVVGLLIDDPASEPPRTTDDVDLIVDAASYRAFGVGLANRLRELGFETPMGARIGRWTVEGVPVDVMPIGEEALGFGNRWYRAAFETAGERRISGDTTLRLVRAPHFVATKLEAFKSRGGGSYVGSQDLEDIVAVIDGRPTLEEEIQAAANDIRGYLADETRRLLAEPAFEDALPGYLRGDPASQARLPRVLEVLRRIAAG